MQQKKSGHNKVYLYVQKEAAKEMIKWFTKYLNSSIKVTDSETLGKQFQELYG